MNQQITKQIEVKAPLSKVWVALTDYQQFGEWFRVKLDAPFALGKRSSGFISYPGYEHIKWDAVIKRIDFGCLFSFTWHPYAIDPTIDYTNEEPTLVEFKLEKTANGTLVTVTESGFDKIPTARREEAFHKNEAGWTEQMKNIENYILRT